MTSAPSASQIDKARIPLRQAADLAIQIEALNSFAPDKLVDQHRRQFLFHMEQVASRLGYRLSPIATLAVDNDSTDEPVVMGR